jgi:SAM-dependent methyltransferase
MSASLAVPLSEPDQDAFAAERQLTARLLQFVERSGVWTALASEPAFSAAEAEARLRSAFGFALEDPLRRRMVRVLLDFLVECGCLRSAGAGCYEVVAAPRSCVAGRHEALPQPARDGLLEFFERCLAHVERFWRGGPPLFEFDEVSTGGWETLLGSGDLAAARRILARLVLPRDDRPCDALVLCYGPGFDIVQIEAGCPAARVTALDFTEAFREPASRRLRNPSKVRWVPAASWGGFGIPLPFADAVFDIVTLACAEPYVPAGCREMVFGDILRVLRPRGVLGLLTHSYPDPSRREVSHNWVRRATYCHDFLESVCRGWQGFSEPSSLRALFSRVGFTVDLVTHNASVWRLSKPAAGPCNTTTS